MFLESRSGLKNLIDAVSPTGVVLTFGNFDGLHLGHKALLDVVVSIAAERDLESVVLTFEPHTATLFRPDLGDFAILEKVQKRQIIHSLGIDKTEFIRFDKQFAEMKAEEFVEKFLLNLYDVRCIVVGPKCRFGKGGRGDIDLLRSMSIRHGFDVIVLDMLSIGDNHHSSSKVRDCLGRGDIKSANAILGRNYSVWGKVTRGDRRGRKLGFPTINLSLEGLLKPKLGVYCGKVFCDVDRTWRYGVINIGSRPTFHHQGEVILEMHIFDFDEDIYGWHTKVELLDFIREERKFASVEPLIKQMKADVQLASKGIDTLCPH